MWPKLVMSFFVLVLIYSNFATAETLDEVKVTIKIEEGEIITVYPSDVSKTIYSKLKETDHEGHCYGGCEIYHKVLGDMDCTLFVTLTDTGTTDSRRYSCESRTSKQE